MRKDSRTMTETQFLLSLSRTTKSYRWYVQGNKIRARARNGKTRGQVFDPVTAVARFTGHGNYGVNQKGRKAAGKATGLTPLLTTSVVNATEAKSNRGNGQVLRGRMRQVLGV